MKKVFLFLGALILSTSMFATDMRIYCKMDKSWWKADGAAVGCHSWEPSKGTTWPGVRMTPVADVNDVWYIDLDTTQVHNVIFTRINGSGTIADWGAKTKDQVIPTDGKNLFTITSSSAVWGDPGCDGEWSVYSKPEPQPDKYFIKNNWNNGSWVWKEMTPNNDSTVWEYTDIFGSWGVNIVKNDTNIAKPAEYPLESRIGGDTIQSNDTVRFAYNVALDSVVATLIGRPAPEVKTYYLVGDYCNWKFDTTAIKAFEKLNDTLTVTIDSLFGEIKITEGKSWAVNYGAYGDSPYELRAGASPYGLKQNGGQNFKFDADYKNAVFQIFMAEKESEQVLHLRFVSGEKVVVPEPVKTYYLVGDYCNWKHDTTAIKAFELVNDTLTVTIDSLFGGIKITEGKGWDVNYGAWGEAPYELHAGASPYGLKQGEGSQNFIFDADYKNAVFQIFMAEKESQQVLHLRFVSGEKVEAPAHYYAKNNWDGSKDWTWKEMTKFSDVQYDLENVIFGGKGININTKDDDEGSLYFPVDSFWILTDTILPLDTIRLSYFTETKQLLVQLVGRPCKDEFGILVNGNYKAATVNPARTEVTEYMVLGVALAVDDSVQMYDNCAKAAWVIEDYMEGSYEFPVVNNKYVVEETATYDFYFQLGSPDKIYIYQQQTTALENNSESIIPNSKFIENGNLYIRRGEHVFDAQGKMVR